MQVKAKSRWRFDPDDLSVPAAVVIVLGLFLICGLFLATGLAARWAGLVLSTMHCSVSSLTAAANTYGRRDSGFWLEFWQRSILAAWIAILLHVERWGLLWFNIMVFELPVFWYLRDWPGLLG